MMAQEPAGAVVMGLNGDLGGGGRLLASESSNSRTLLERVVGEGENPVGDVGSSDVQIMREYRPTREIGWEAGGTTSQG